MFSLKGKLTFQLCETRCGQEGEIWRSIALFSTGTFLKRKSLQLKSKRCKQCDDCSIDFCFALGALQHLFTHCQRAWDNLCDHLISLCICLCHCIVVGQLMSPHHCDQMSQRSQVFRVGL